MYHIYIFSQPNMNNICYEIIECETLKVLATANTKYEFKLKLNLNGINKDHIKLDKYGIFKDFGGGLCSFDNNVEIGLTYQFHFDIISHMKIREYSPNFYNCVVSEFNTKEELFDIDWIKCNMENNDFQDTW